MQEKHNIKKPYYPDVALFLVLIPFISAFNYYLTYSSIKLSWFLLLTFSIDTVQGYLAWVAVRAIILYLDRRFPYEKGMLKRIILQLSSTTFIGLSIISILTEMVSWIAKGKPAPLHFYTVDLFIISIWFFVINGIYIGLHFYNLWQQSESIRQQEQRIKTDGLLARQGKTDIKLPFEEVDGLFVDGEYVAACTIKGKKYYLDHSLDKIEHALPASIFFRLNRQYILNRRIITGFKRAENGKLNVLVSKTNFFPGEITVSRIKASTFKGWFHPGDNISS